MNVTVWNENVHEKNMPEMNAIHPEGLHGTVAAILRELPEANVRIATLDMPEAGLPNEVLNNTDVLFWWAHEAHKEVPDALVDKICQRVHAGMGLVALHSSHLAKVFTRLMGTSGMHRWCEEAYERIFCVDPTHPIAEGVPMHFELGIEECYAEYFNIPKPDELIFISWFDNGEVYRSGCTWRRGLGKIFFFQPGHETFHSFENPHVRKILQNACRWAIPACPGTIPATDPKQDTCIRESLESLRKK